MNKIEKNKKKFSTFLKIILYNDIVFDSRLNLKKKPPNGENLKYVGHVVYYRHVMAYYAQKRIFMEKQSDKELMKLVTARDTAALKILYQRYEKKIFNFILRYTGSREIAREMIQEAFTRVWFAAHTFDREGGNFKGWVYTIALNLTRNEMSKKKYSYHYVEADENRDWQHEAAAGTETDDEGPEAVFRKKRIKRRGCPGYRPTQTFSKRGYYYEKLPAFKI
ncbi:MAG: sigma-70 family RNA polymerase sigma factor [Candidatus Aminicenantes bacterium]|nr:sigma-70 family RNA polymerase sigma factor [Candidatus Aminicenantes bacterium]